VSSEGKLFMVMMPQNKRSRLATPVTAGQNGAFAAAVLEPEKRTGNQNLRTPRSRTVKRRLRTRKLPHKYMLLRTLRRELKVSKQYICEICH